MILPMFSWVLSVTFLLLGALHLYWIIGGKWGIHGAIPTSTDHGKPLFTPGKAGTAVVMLLLWLKAFWVLMLGQALPSILPSWLVVAGGYAISLVFLIRSIGDFRYIGFFKRYRSSLFARMDSRYYSPLCLTLGGATLILLLMN